MERKEETTRIKKKRLIAGLAAIFLLCAVIALLPSNKSIWNGIYRFFGVTDYTSAADEYPLSVHYLDVGKADCILIEQEGHFVLIDGGDKEERNRVTEYLRRRQVETLDLVVVSHPDKDHIGAMEDVVREFTINNFLMPKLQDELIPDSTRYQKMIEAIEDTNLAVTYPKPGDTYRVGDMLFEVLAPLKEYEDTNNSSIILKMTFEETSFLFMGDAEQEAEEDLLSSGAELTADVLKAGHHGSKTSTTQKLLKAVQPQIVVVSTGEDRNNLPKGEVLERIEQSGAELYRTDLDGTVIVSSDGKELSVTTEK